MIVNFQLKKPFQLFGRQSSIASYAIDILIMRDIVRIPHSEKGRNL